MNLQLEGQMGSDVNNQNKSAVNVLSQKEKEMDTTWYKKSTDDKPPTERKRRSIDLNADV